MLCYGDTDDVHLDPAYDCDEVLQQIARTRDSFIPTAFELLILSKFAESDHIVDNEPTISSGVPEAARGSS